jgi:hypothetical protein
LAIVALLSMLPAIGVAEVYKWVDEDGVTHYSQQPPPQGSATMITPDAPADTASGGDAPGEAGDGEGGEESGESDGDGEQETIAEFCQELRDKEKVLQSDRPIRIKAADGTLTDLDDEGRAQRLERIQGQLRDHCQGLEAQAG